MKATIVITVFAALSTLALAANSALPVHLMDVATWDKAASLDDKPENPHMGAIRAVYVNRIAAKAWAGRNALPINSVVAKVIGDINAPAMLAVMTKTSAGWRYEVQARQSDGSYVEAVGPRKLGSTAFCAECHSEAENDQLFTRQ
jgi:Cytochrome P460